MMFFTVLRTEMIKLRRTRILWILALIYTIAPVMMALMMAALRYPELGQQLGLLTTKAQLTIGDVDWQTYLLLLSYLCVGGIILMGIVNAFLFGREYAEGTAKNLLTLPTHRAMFVAAKLLIGGLWFIAVELVIVCIGLALGSLIDLPGFSPELLASGLANMGLICLQVILVSSLPAWIAVATRGYIAPLGFSVLFLLIGDLFSQLSWGTLVPWSVILLQAGSASGEAASFSAGSMIVLCISFAAGFAASWLTLEKSDNTQ